MPETDTQTDTQQARPYDPAKQRAYYERFYAKKSQLGQIVCPICLGHYTYFNKSHHVKGIHHLRAVSLAQRIKDMKAAAEGKAKYQTLDTILSFEDLQNLPISTPSCLSIASN
jgi:hypothetical protein